MHRNVDVGALSGYLDAKRLLNSQVTPCVASAACARTACMRSWRVTVQTRLLRSRA